MAKKTHTRKTKQPDGVAGGRVSINVKRVVPPDMKVMFSDSFVVTHTDTEYIFSFLQTQHPIDFDGEGEPKGAVEQVCFARIAVTPEQALRILQALATNVSRGKPVETKDDGNTGE